MRSEFDLIHHLKTKYGLSRVGDDCAVLPNNEENDLVVTADMLVEDIDFRLEWTTPGYLGHKSLAVSLSDVAAMGAEPIWSMLSIAVPEKLWNNGFIDQFYEGWIALAREHGVELVGGDVSRSLGGLVIDSIVGGRVAKGRAILRSGAKPGDLIYVTGSLGGASGGLRLLERGSDDLEETHELLLKQLRPQPKLVLAKILQHLQIVTSMVDISDGLSSDLSHICRASSVGARIYAERLPANPDLQNHFPSKDCLEMALNGGEDFELLFTCSDDDRSLLKSNDLTLIGEITADTGVIEMIRNGRAEDLYPHGYRHF